MKKKNKNILIKVAIAILIILILLGLSRCNRNEDTGDKQGENLISTENDSSELETTVDEDTVGSEAESEEKDEGKNVGAEENKEDVSLEDKKENVSKENDKKEDLSSTEKKEESKKPAENKNETNNKPADNPGKQEEGKEEPQKPSHVHTWEEVKNTIEHQEEGHYEDVLVKEAWTEEVPIYETVAVEICNTCGADITGNTSAHLKEHMLKGENGSRRTEYVQKQTGVEQIQHAAVYEKKWVVDKKAWTETLITYKCSCGQTK